MKPEEKTQHTPGPWNLNPVFQMEGYGYFISCIRDGTETVMANPNIAQVFLLGDGNGEAEANASLIAAAPDLLAEMEKLLWVARSYEVTWVARSYEVTPDGEEKTLLWLSASHLKRIEIAIAKARGAQ